MNELVIAGIDLSSVAERLSSQIPGVSAVVLCCPDLDSAVGGARLRLSENYEQLASFLKEHRLLLVQDLDTESPTIETRQGDVDVYQFRNALKQYVTDHETVRGSLAAFTLKELSHRGDTSDQSFALIFVKRGTPLDLNRAEDWRYLVSVEVACTRLDQYTRTADALLKFPGTVSTDEVLPRLASEATFITESAGALIYVLTSPDELSLVQHSGEQILTDDILPIDSEFGIVPLTFQSGEPQCENEYSKWDKAVPKDRRNFDRILTHPLMVEQKCIGVIGVFRKSHQRQYQVESEGKLLPRLAQQAALAMDRALLLENMNLVSELSVEITREFDDEALMRLFVHRATDYLKCNHCTIFIAEDGGRLVSTYSSVKETLGVTFEVDEGIVGKAFTEQETQILADATKSQWWARSRKYKDRDEEPPRSMLAVPITSGNRCIAVFVADRDERSGWFSTTDRTLVETLARQLGFVLERSRVFRSFAVPRGAQPPQVLNVIAKTCLTITRGIIAAIYVFDSDRQLISNHVYPENENFPKPRLDLPTGLTRTILKTGKILAISNAGIDKRVNPDLLQFGVRSITGIPLLIGGSPSGVLFVNYDEPDRPTPVETEILKSFSNLAALTIANEVATTFSVSRLASLGGSLAVSHGLEDALVGLTGLALDFLHQANGFAEVLILNEAKDQLTTVAHTRSSPVGQKWSIEDGITGWVAREAKACYAENVADYKKLFFDPLNLRAESEMAVPIEDPNTHRILGVLNIELPKVAEFEEGHKRLAELVATLAAVIMTNSKTLDRIAKNVARLQQYETTIEIVSEVRHTVNNLSGRIPDFCEEALSQCSCGRSEPVVSRIRKANKRLLEFTRELFPEPKSFSVASALKSGVDFVRPLAVSKKATLICSPGEAYGFGRPSYVKSAIREIVWNAIEHNPPGVQVTVRGEFTSGRYRVTITDTGLGGLDESAFRLDYSAKGLGGGYGLWRAHELLNSLGTRVSIGPPPDSDLGTRFEIVFSDAVTETPSEHFGVLQRAENEDEFAVIAKTLKSERFPADERESLILCLDLVGIRLEEFPCPWRLPHEQSLAANREFGAFFGIGPTTIAKARTGLRRLRQSVEKELEGEDRAIEADCLVEKWIMFELDGRRDVNRSIKT